jgi:DNA-binding LacI/PurR family transcriptional regulator
MKHKIAKHRLVADKIRLRINEGSYRPGVSLPGRRQLATEYDAAPLTIQTAIDELVAEGLLRTETGRGTFVAEIGRSEQASHRPTPEMGLVGLLARAWMDNWDEPLNDNTLIVKSAERAVARAGGASTCQNLHRRDGSRMRIMEGVRLLVDKGVSGIVVVNEDIRAQVEELVASPEFQSVPFVFAVGQDLALPLSSAYYDNVHWGEIAAQHLIDRGCRRLLFFSPFNIGWAIDRASGARDVVVREKGRSVTLDSIIGECSVGNGFDKEYFSTENYLRISTAYASEHLSEIQGYDGVICANDPVAIAFREVIERAGQRAGTDYALIGFDDTGEARSAGLTSLQRPADRLGRLAVELLARLQRGEEGPVNTRVAAHVIARETTNVKLKTIPKGESAKTRQ